MKQYYYKAGVFPHNCSNSSFEDDFGKLFVEGLMAAMEDENS